MEYLGEEYKLPIIISGSMSTNGNGTGKSDSIDLLLNKE